MLPTTGFVGGRGIGFNLFFAGMAAAPYLIRDVPKDLTTNAQLRVGELQDYGFDDSTSALRDFGALLAGEARI